MMMLRAILAFTFFCFVTPLAYGAEPLVCGEKREGTEQVLSFSLSKKPCVLKTHKGFFNSAAISFVQGEENAGELAFNGRNVILTLPEGKVVRGKILDCPPYGKYIRWTRGMDNAKAFWGCSRYR